jgi:hypothetical protein
MAKESTNILHCKTFQNLPKSGFLVLKSGNPAGQGPKKWFSFKLVVGSFEESTF